jgi:hypothetical protein
MPLARCIVITRKCGLALIVSRRPASRSELALRIAAAAATSVAPLPVF